MTDKKTLFINDTEVGFTDEKNVLEVARHAGINIPTLCYRPDLTFYGACRMCVVEQVGRGIQAACTLPPKEGMQIRTNTTEIRKIRKNVIELLLARHNRECTLCTKSGSCDLQKFALEYGITEIRYEKIKEEDFPKIDNSSLSISRDMSKCILCGACIRACSEFQGIGVLGFSKRGADTQIQPMAGYNLAEVDCVNCGQCVSVCPTGALTVKPNISEVMDALCDYNIKTVIQIAPSVRVALGEMFGLKPGDNSIKKIYAAAKKIGFNLVFDTNFSADLTIMEEAHEFVERVSKGENLPLFTSCCPAWVRYMELKHPDMLNHLSSAKSPQGMLSAVMKRILPKEYEGYTKENIRVVSVMPCTAKKYEANRDELLGQTDYVLTTYEFAKLIQSQGIDFDKLEEIEADSPFGTYSGGGTIFGASGGVAEAAVRTAYNMITGENLDDINIVALRGVDEHSRSKEAQIDIKGKKVKIRVVSTLVEAEKAVQEVIKGTADFQMLEVMACPGGCINGGGQPSGCKDSQTKVKRSIGLYKEDEALPIRNSHQNPDIIKLYEKYLEKPGSELAHKLLHTTFSNKKTGSYTDFSK